MAEAAEIRQNAEPRLSSENGENPRVLGTHAREFLDEKIEDYARETPPRARVMTNLIDFLETQKQDVPDGERKKIAVHGLDVMKDTVAGSVQGEQDPDMVSIVRGHLKKLALEDINGEEKYQDVLTAFMDFLPHIDDRAMHNLNEPNPMAAPEVQAANQQRPDSYNLQPEETGRVLAGVGTGSE